MITVLGVEVQVLEANVKIEEIEEVLNLNKVPEEDLGTEMIVEIEAIQNRPTVENQMVEDLGHLGVDMGVITEEMRVGEMDIEEEMIIGEMM